MQAVDLYGILNEYLLDNDRKIPKAHLDTVCKCKAEGACRYIALSEIGFVCMKNSPMKEPLDKKVEDGLMNATGDNCEGLGD